MSTIEVNKRTNKTVVVGGNTKTEIIEIKEAGVAGPPNNLAIGTVTTGNAPAVSITGTAPSQTLNLVLPVGGTFTHTQYSPSTTWTVTHNLGYKPNVTVVDSAGTIIEGEIDYQSGNTVILTFSSSFAGTAHLS